MLLFEIHVFSHMSVHVRKLDTFDPSVANTLGFLTCLTRREPGHTTTMSDRPDKAITMDSSHAFPPPSAQTAPHQSPPKLRSSCDACGETKVKCDRAQPECSRCVEAGVPCVYGPSRNRGKPPRK